jgi:hypothetical protein
MPMLHLKKRRHQGAGWPLRTLLAVLMITAVIILIVMQRHKPDVEQATDQAAQFVHAMQANEPDLAYDMGDEAFRKATTEQELGSMFDKARPFLDRAYFNQADVYYAVSEKGNPRAIIVYTAALDTHVTYIRLVLERQGARRSDPWKAHSLLTQSTVLQAKPE